MAHGRVQRFQQRPGSPPVARVLAIGLLGASLAACGATGPAAPLPTAGSSVGQATTAKPTAAATPAEPTLPPGVSMLRDGVLEPGTYRFEGFEPWLEVTIAGEGWEVGHFHDEIFDLFLDGDFPAIGFARFPTVATPASSAAPDGSAVPASSLDVVLEALRTNPDVVVTDVGAAEIAGLAGRTVDVEATKAGTALFGSGSEGFHFDPGFVGRFHLLEVDDGVLEVFISHRSGNLDEAIEATRAILDSLRVIEPAE